MPDMLQITLPDGSSKQVPAGTTVGDFVKTQIGAGLAKAALFAKLDDEELDLSRPLSHGGKLMVITSKQREGLDLIRHDAAHVVASVVQRLFPGTQVTIGPSTEDGFYYDFFRKEPFTPEDLEKIEKAANEEIKKDLPFVRKEVSREEALQLFDRLGETFKKEIVEDIFSKGAKTLTLYSHGDWVDFCLGPHAPSTGKIGVNKLLWERSGHWGKYRENMFLVLDPESKEKDIEERASFSLKPMNCPSHYLFYQMKKHSYRELPIRYHTQDVLHRNEATGVLSGLTRVRQF